MKKEKEKKEDIFKEKSERVYVDLLSIPQSGGKMSKRLGGIIGCKEKTSFVVSTVSDLRSMGLNVLGYQSHLL